MFKRIAPLLAVALCYNAFVSTAAPTTAAACANSLYGQCGGQNWNGSTCCPTGAQCKFSNSYYSQCLAVSTVAPTAAPTAGPTCANTLYGQCGGQNWNGSTCCPTGSACVFSNSYYSQCLIPSTGAPTHAPTASPTTGPTCANTLYGQCGGQNWNGSTCCPKGSECKFSNSYYSQCLVPSTGAPTSVPTTAPTAAPTTGPTCANTLYGQCGGQNWNGSTCCPKGSECKFSNSYYSQCLVPSTGAPTQIPTSAPTAAPTAGPTCANTLYGQCGGQNWNGPTCCPTGSQCKFSNSYYSQCLVPSTGTPTSVPTTAPTAAPTTSPTCSNTLYGQCGGQSWNGPTCCPTGSQCKFSNSYYSQCLSL